MEYKKFFHGLIMFIGSMFLDFQILISKFLVQHLELNYIKAQTFWVDISSNKTVKYAVMHFVRCGLSNE